MKHVALTVLGLAALAVVFGPGGPAPNAGPDAITTAPAAAPSSGSTPAGAGYTSEGIRIARDGSGQFHLDLAVNAVPTRFLVDTGADVVALTESDARAAGIPVSSSDYQQILQTASGPGWGMPVRIDRLEIGRAELRDVDAVVARDLAVSLLGQSVLRRVGRVELQGDQITIEPAG